LETLQQFKTGAENEKCEGCGLRVAAMPDRQGYKIPGLAGLHCTIECVEVHLFGHEACRWCGSEMLKTYTGIDSRLCSDGCSQNYYRHVAPLSSDQTARLGSGKRFLRWLQNNQPEAYALLAGKPVEPNTLKLGRPTKNGHAMTAAERKRAQRGKRLVNVY
jgi:hypothetical protein